MHSPPKIVPMFKFWYSTRRNKQSYDKETLWSVIDHPQTAPRKTLSSHGSANN